MKINTIVFDLDGTLYEDTHHFQYYADLLKQKLPDDVRQSFEQDYAAVGEGSHTLKVGRVYDAEKDLVLSHENGVVKTGWTWTGERVPEEELSKHYSKEPLQFDLLNMLSIGDLWWVPVSIAKHYGLTSEEAYKAFLETRDHMMTDEFVMEPLKEFAEVLEKLHSSYNLVLMTNSPQTDSDIILKKLGFTSYFHDKIFEANKPVRTADQLTYISKKWNVPFENMLSVGDNYINEILPAALLGCKTIFIDPFDLYKKSDATYTVNGLHELAGELERALLNNTK
jgi:FMN phosphatase YigB (HAD superfamily)